MKIPGKELWYRAKEIFPWFLAACAALGSNLAATAVQETIDAIKNGDCRFSYVNSSYLAFFIVALILLIKQRSAFFMPRTRFMKSEIPEKKQHLVLFLSKLNTTHPLSDKDGVPAGITLEGNFKDDLEKLVEYKERNKPLKWEWEMPLRAVQHHVGAKSKLKTITIVCSPESILQVGWFQNVLRKYGELASVKVQILVKNDNEPALVASYDKSVHEGWDFEAFDELSIALFYLLGNFRKQNIPEKEIMIDFTGGQKVTSVVAAAISFNRKIKAQYVQTSPDKQGRYNIVSYDMVLGTAETGHGA